MDPMELLTKAPIFEGLAPAELEPLRTAIRTRSFAKGAYLFREGDPGSHLYMVVEGEAKIGRVGEGGGQEVFAIVGPGEGFGGLSLFDDEGERTADAQALKPATSADLPVRSPFSTATAFAIAPPRTYDSR